MATMTLLSSIRHGESRRKRVVALDGTKLIVLMLAGAVLALAGLWSRRRRNRLAII
jgi:LPXTG-motif cell wall-anchored protein